MKYIKLVFATALFALFIPFLSSAQTKNSATIYYNEACGDCGVYVKTHLPPMLKAAGYSDIELRDYINDKSARSELNKKLDELAIPIELQSHIMAFVGDKLIFGGHVPDETVNYLLKPENQNSFDRIIVYQDEMHKTPASYKVWGFSGPIKEYSINTPIAEYLNYFEQNKNQFSNTKTADGAGFLKLLPIVLSSGLIDGINPCAFAVLLFFIGFLYTIRRSKTDVLKMGAAYIGAMYLVYLLIGVGMLKAIMISDTPMIMGKVGSLLVIFLGTFNLINYFWPQMPRIKIPQFSKKYFLDYMHKATIPAAAIAGALVGLCVFPCSGGIYVAIVAMLSSKVTQITGLVYLLLYNIMFVMPLVLILAVASNKKVSEKLQVWQAHSARKMNLYANLAMILVGVIIWVWFL